LRALIATDGLPAFRGGEKRRRTNLMIRRQVGTRPGQKTGHPRESCRLDETGYGCIFDPHVVCPNRLRSPQLIRACELAPPAGRCRGREPAKRPPRRGQTNLSHLYDRPDPVRPADIQLSSCPFRLLVRARSTHSSNCVSSKGLAKNPIAPALIACSRIRSSGNAVMKIIGVVLP
jgi:hypothetical protein